MNSFEQDIYDYYDGAQKAEVAKKRFLDNPDEMARFNGVIEAIPPDVHSLLDLGCGHGFFLQLLKEKNIRAVGLERSKERIKIASELFQLDILQGSIDLLPFQDQAFDAITALEVIEHLPFGVYENALREMERVARKYIILSVPHRERRIFIRCPYCQGEFNPSYHLRSFNEKMLYNLFKQYNLINYKGVLTRYHIPLLNAVIKTYRNTTGYFPPNTICPCCGYRKEIKLCATEKITPDFNKIHSMLQSWRMKVGCLFFWMKSYRWIIATYKRK